MGMVCHVFEGKIPIINVPANDKHNTQSDIIVGIPIQTQAIGISAGPTLRLKHASMHLHKYAHNHQQFQALILSYLLTGLTNAIEAKSPL